MNKIPNQTTEHEAYMREIKFRIWDKQNKNWITENGQSLHCFSNWSICPFTGKLTDYVGAIDTDHGETYTANPAPDYYITDSTHERNLSTFTALVIREPRYVIQQYTGLKDKNGKDIYEGDIISGEFFDTEYRHAETITHEVVFNNGRFNIAMKEWHKPSLKIIGNIFETPELLKQ